MARRFEAGYRKRHVDSGLYNVTLCYYVYNIVQYLYYIIRLKFLFMSKRSKETLIYNRF